MSAQEVSACIEQWKSINPLDTTCVALGIVDVCGLAIDNARKYEKINNSYIEKKTLLRELQHRAKNSFTMICSLVTLMKDSTLSEEVKLNLDEIYSRVMAISELYNILFLTDSVSDVLLDQYLDRIASMLPYSSDKISIKKDR